MTSHFWETESKETFNRREADTWAKRARKSTFEWIDKADPTTPPSQLSLDNFFNRHYTKPNDLDEIEPNVGKGKESSRFNPLEALDSASSTIFGGKIRQPWDVLRPVQRLLEAEQKYIAAPLARELFKSGSLTNALGLDYNVNKDIPPWLRTVTEVGVDPLTYLGPGAISALMKGALRSSSVARLAAPGLDSLFASSSQRLAVRMLEDFGINLGGVAGAELANAAGLPPILGAFAGGVATGKGIQRLRPRDTVVYVFSRKDIPIFRGGSREYVDLTDPNNPIPRDLPSAVPPDLRNFSVSAPGVVYASTSREVASGFAGGELPKMGGKVTPMVLPRGTKYWSPARDPWPDMHGADKWTQDSMEEARDSFRKYNKNIHWNTASRNLENNFFDTVDTNIRDLIFASLRKTGYKALRTGNEVIILDDSVLKPYFTPERFPGQAAISPDDTRRRLKDQGYTDAEIDEINSTFNVQSPEARTAEIKADQEFSGTNIRLSRRVGNLSKRMEQDAQARQAEAEEPAPNTRYHMLQREESLNKGPMEDEYYRGLLSTATKGGLPKGETYRSMAIKVLADEESIRIMRERGQLDLPESEFRPIKLALHKDLIKEFDTSKIERLAEAEKRIGGGPGTPVNTNYSPMTRLIMNLARAPIDKTNAKTRDEALAWAEETKTLMAFGRNFVGKSLPPSTTEWFRKRGVRLIDSGATPFIEHHSRMRALGKNYGPADAEVMRAALRHRDIPVRDVRDVGTVVDDPNLIMQAGALSTPDLNLLDNQGRLHLEDLQEHHKLFTLKPAQQTVLDALDSPMRNLRELEDLYEFKRQEAAPNGYYAHREKIAGQVRNAEGELVDIELGTPPTNQMGTSQYDKRAGKTKADEVNANAKFLPYVEGQSARITKGYKAMADNWLERALAEESKTVTDLLPSDLVNDLNTVRWNQKQVNWMIKELGRAGSIGLKGGWKPPTWTPVDANMANFVGEASRISNIDTKAARVKAWSDLQADMGILKKSNNVRISSLNREKQLIMDQARANKDSPYRMQYPAEFNNRYYKLETGQELQAVNADYTPTGVLAGLDWLNNTTRPIMATLDVSFMGVQGLVAALSNPTAYYRTLKTIYSTGGYLDYMDSMKKSGMLDSMIKDGVHVAARNDFAEFIFPRQLSRIPVLGKASDASNALFTQFGNVLRSELYKSGLAQATDAKSRASLARSVNLISGFNPGDPTSIEKTLIFAPRFFRAQLGLLTDAVSKREFSKSRAASSLSAFVASGVGLTFFMNEMLGNETEINPNSPNFMRVRFGDKDFSIFGTWDTLVRAMTKGVDNPGEGVEYLARVKAAPVISRMLDLWEGETLGGASLNWSSPTEILKSAGELAATNLPISIQQIGSEPPDLSSPTSIAGSAIQFVGTKSSPLSPSERLVLRSEMLSQNEYQKPWDSLEPFQRAALKKKYNLDLPSRTELDYAFDAHAGISDRFSAQQAQLDTTMPIGPNWIDAHQELKRERIGAYGEWAQENPDAVAKLRHAKATTPDEQARQGFFQVLDTADKENWSSAELGDAIEDFNAGLSATQLSFIERNTGLSNTPRVKEYNKAQQVLRPYWSIADSVWEKMAPRLPGGQSAATLQEYVNNRILEMQEQGVPDRLISRRIQSNPILKEVARATSELRRRYRSRHSAVDVELVKWYGYTSLREQ